MKKICIAMVCLLCFQWSWSQTTLQVLTKTVQKTIDWKPGYSLEVNGEKANVQILPATGSQIVVKAELSAKHPRVDTARTDLEAWKLVVTKVGKIVYIRAYIGLSAKDELPSSNMKSKIQVWVPAECPVNVVNKFGSTKVENMKGQLALKGEFCNIDLQNLSGKVLINSRFGNVQARSLSGPLQLDIRRADADLTGMQNACNIQSEYGSVLLETSQHTGNVHIKSNKSDVTLQTKGSVLHNYDLKCIYGSLQLPEGKAFRLEQPDAHTQHASLQNGADRKNITVETNFGKITVH